MAFKKNFCVIIGILIVSFTQAQKDTLFWFAAPYICHGHANKPVIFRISNYDKPADIVISEPSNPLFISYSFHLNAYSEQNIDASSQIGYLENTYYDAYGNNYYDSVLNYGIKITASNYISAYYEIVAQNSAGSDINPEIFPLKGNVGIGTNFLIPGQTDFANAQALTGQYNPQPKNGFIIVATEDNDTVKIVPSNDVIHYSKNDTITKVLNKGQSYAVVAQNFAVGTHLGGSIVIASKPVSVTIYDDTIGDSFAGPTSGSRDLIGDQIISENNNGNEFIIVRGNMNDGYYTQDYYYIWATQDNTVINITDANGSITTTTINRGGVFKRTFYSASEYITTSNPVYVYQVTGEGQEMASTNLPSITCTGSQLVSFVRSTNETFQLNLLCHTADIGNFLVNGNAVIPSYLFQPVVGTNGSWMAARITSSSLPNIDNIFKTLVTTVVSNTTGLFHLGFLNGGTTTGTRLGYFSNYSKILLSPSVLNSLTCVATDIQLSATTVSGANYTWTGPNGYTATGSQPKIINPTLSNSGTYIVKADFGNGCPSSSDSLKITVHPLPTVNFTKSLDTLCYGSSKNVNFSLTGTAPWTFIYKDSIKAINDTIASIKTSPSYFTASPLASNTYRVLNITDSNSCVLSTVPVLANIDTLMVDTLPVANFKFTYPNCQKNTVYFSDSSKTYLDSLTQWYWIFSNGDVKQTYSRYTIIPEIFSNWGADSVKLAVQTALGCKSDTTVRSFTVNPLPVPGFVLPQLCLTDAFAQFADTTSIGDHSSGFKYFWNFGDSLSSDKYPDTSSSQNPLHHYSSQGHYWVSETVTSANGCIDSTKELLTVNGAVPHANFALNNLATKCSNDSVKITNLSTVDFGAVTWLKIYWDFLNHPLIYDSVPTPLLNDVYAHLYPAIAPPSANYTIHFAAYSGSSCINIKDTVINVTASPVVQFTTIPGICFDAAARQINTASEINNINNGVFSYTGNGVSSSGLFDPKLAGVGTDTLMALYISSAGCRDSAKNTITVWPSPTAKWSFSNPDCEKDSIIFTDNSVANYSNIIQWDWNFGDGTALTNLNNKNFSKVYSVYGSYTAFLIVKTDSGCISKADSQVIAVHPLPSVNFGMPAIVCLPGGNAQFTDSTSIADNSASLFTYKWNFGDSNNPEGSVLKNPVHQYSALGNYTVSLIVTSTNLCVDSTTKVFSNIYPQPKADFSMSASEICMNDNISFTDHTSGYTGNLVSWNWNLAEGNTSTLQNPARIFADSGTYAITLFAFDAKGCVSDTVTKPVVIDPFPHLNITHTVFVLQGGSIVLMPDFYALSPTQFNWSPATYLDSTTVPYPVSKPNDNITYQLILTGKGNCSISDTVLVTVMKTPAIPNAFSPNGDGINDTWEIKYLNTYPGCVVQVFDRDGQPVFNSVGYNVNWDGTFNGKPLPIGTYYYVINPKNGRALMSGSVTIIR